MLFEFRFFRYVFITFFSSSVLEDKYFWLTFLCVCVRNVITALISLCYFLLLLTLTIPPGRTAKAFGWYRSVRIGHTLNLRRPICLGDTSRHIRFCEIRQERRKERLEKQDSWALVFPREENSLSKICCLGFDSTRLAWPWLKKKTLCRRKKSCNRYQLLYWHKIICIIALRRRRRFHHGKTFPCSFAIDEIK